MKKNVILLSLAAFSMAVCLCVNTEKTPSSSPEKSPVSKTESLEELVKQFDPLQEVEAYASAPDSIGL